MQRCAHMYESGIQCNEEVLPDGNFCGDHEVIHDFFEPLTDHPFRKLIMRVAALILLIVFLIPFYYTLKTMYLNQAVTAQEAQ